MSVAEQAVERETAFKLLREIAENAARKGRLCYAASAKPQLLQVLQHTEAQLGYANFRELLRDAEAGGWVQLTYVPAGDVQIDPGVGVSGDQTTASVAEAAPEPAAPPQRGERPVVRHDFWQAVVRPGTWLYDPHSDGVVTEASTGTREDLVPLPTADEDAQESWIKEFVATLPSQRQTALATALEGRDLKAQLELLVAQPVSVREAWFNFRAVRVLERLETWKKERGLPVHLTRARAPRRGSGQEHSSRRPPSHERDDVREQAVRARLHEALDRMPLSDLLRLPIPAEFLIDA